MINYDFIVKAHKHYEGYGYVRMEVPWWTSLKINHITKPDVIKHIPDFHIPLNDKVLVASAEQSFLSLAEKNELPKGRFFATTPCFRNEPNTELSCQYFIKTELIDTEHLNHRAFSGMVDEALGFFESVVPNVCELEILKTDEGFDITYGGIEIGSYGIRSCEFLDWIYGTGVAEPRLSRAIKKTHYEGYDSSWWPLL